MQKYIDKFENFCYTKNAKQNLIFDFSHGKYVFCFTAKIHMLCFFHISMCDVLNFVWRQAGLCVFRCVASAMHLFLLQKFGGNDMNEKTCCFIGHRKIDTTEDLEKRLYVIIEDLILNKDVNVFLFGSKSDFDDLCHKIISKLKEKYPYIKRIYVRAEYMYKNDFYENSLRQFYEDSYYPENIIKAGRCAYVERNYEIINKSEFCVFYFDENYAPNKRRSGTKIAYDYAVKKKKTVINLYDEIKRSQ